MSAGKRDQIENFYQKIFHKCNECKFDHSDPEYLKKNFFYNLVPYPSTHPIYLYNAYMGPLQ